MEHEQLECQKKVEKERINFNNQSTISPSIDQEIRDACNLSDENSSSDEW
jgi:hypothetical protein